MSLQVSKSGGGDFTPAPAGKWQAVCVDVRDEGMQRNPFNTENPDKLVHKCSIHFQLKAPSEDGRMPIIAKWFTLSLHEKAALSAFLCEWFECGYSQIPDDFDIESLIGFNARMRIIQEPKKDGSGVRAIIQSIEKWDGADVIAPSADYIRKCDRPEQAFAPDASQPLPPTNRAPQSPMMPAVVPNAAPSGAAPADYRPEGAVMPDARAQQRDKVKRMAKGDIQSPMMATPKAAPGDASWDGADDSIFDAEDESGLTSAEMDAASVAGSLPGLKVATRQKNTAHV